MSEVSFFFLKKVESNNVIHVFLRIVGCLVGIVLVVIIIIMYSSSHFYNEQSAGKGLHMDKSKKYLDFAAGTPETQPETPDSHFFDIEPYSSEKRPRDDDAHSFLHAHPPIFSPISHTAMNLQEDYEAEGRGAFHHFDYLGDMPRDGLTPVAERSSKRLMIEALRAIARTPEKKKNDDIMFHSKKGFLSALRGVAATPVKKEKEENETCDDVRFDDSGKDESTIAVDTTLPEEETKNPNVLHGDENMHVQTPFKLHDPKSECSEEYYFDTYSYNTNSSSSPFDEQSSNSSPSVLSESKDLLLTPSDSMASGRERFEATLATTPNETVGVSMALDNYRAAEKDYKEALREFESEMAQANYSTPASYNVPYYTVGTVHKNIVVDETFTMKSSLDFHNSEGASLEEPYKHDMSPVRDDARHESTVEECQVDASPVVEVPYQNELPQSYVAENKKDQSLVNPQSAASLPTKATTVENNVIDDKEKESPNSNKNASFASTDVNIGAKTPCDLFARRQKFIFRAELPDVSPAKSDETESVSKSVASSVVTQKMSSVTKSAMKSLYADVNSIERANEEYTCNVNSYNTTLSPNLLDKANLSPEISSSFQRPTSSKTFQEEGQSNTYDSKSMLSPNLLDKAFSKPQQREIVTKKNGSENIPRAATDRSKDVRSHVDKSFSFSQDVDCSDGMKHSYPSMGKKMSKVNERRSNIEPDSFLPFLKENLPENVNAAAILSDAMKLNLGPMLTREILQSLVSVHNEDSRVPALGINHINIETDNDDHSDISSLGTASIFSSAAFSTFSAWVRNHPQDPIANLIQDLHQNTQLHRHVDKTEQAILSSSDETWNPVSFQQASSKPATKPTSVKLKPPPGDTRRSRRRWEIRKVEEEVETPAVESHILKDFDKLQQQLKTSMIESRAMVAATKEVEREYDALQNEKLMNQFEQIEKLECQRRWNNATKKDVSRSSSKPPVLSKSFSSVLSSNDWFVDLNPSIEAEDTNESFTSLLCTNKVNDTQDIIHEKKKLYEHQQNDGIEDSTTGENEDRVMQKKKKKKMVLKKMMKMIKRKKSSKNDEDRSIGIASVTSMTLSECQQGKKKNRFKFLSSLRRKNKGNNVRNDDILRDDSKLNDEAVINERIIIDTMQMMDDMEIENLDELDQSFTTDDSDVSSSTSKGGSCAYSSLS